MQQALCRFVKNLISRSRFFHLRRRRAICVHSTPLSSSIDSSTYRLQLQTGDRVPSADSATGAEAGGSGAGAVVSGAAREVGMCIAPREGDGDRGPETCQKRQFMVGPSKGQEGSAERTSTISLLSFINNIDMSISSSTFISSVCEGGYRSQISNEVKAFFWPSELFQSAIYYQGLFYSSCEAFHAQLLMTQAFQRFYSIFVRGSEACGSKVI